MSTYSEENTYEKVLERVLGHNLLEVFDKREGGVAYNTCAPFSLEISNLCALLDIFKDQSYLLTATGENLDNRAYDFGISRTQATYAKRVGRFLNESSEAIDVPIGTRFSVPTEETDTQILFSYTGIEDGYKILTCETAGTIGNTYVGDLVAIDYVKGLAKASIIDTYQLANDIESDDAFRQRVRESLTTKAFGGNIAQYIETIRAMSGVGNVKIYPAWNDIGSVLCSIVDGTYDPIPATVVNRIKEELDPSDRTGEGVGLVPIGHKVTVTTPKKYNCDLYIKIKLQGGIVLDDIRDQLLQGLEEYFFNLRKSFAQDVTISVFRSRITEALLKNQAVVNVTEVLINGFDEDVTFDDTATVDGQTIPYLGEEVVFEQTA